MLFELSRVIDRLDSTWAKVLSRAQLEIEFGKKNLFELLFVARLALGSLSIQQLHLSSLLQESQPYVRV